MTGARLWCYGDYQESLWNLPPLDEARHESFFGLWQSNYSPKSAVAEIKHLAGSEALDSLDDFSWIEIDAGEFYRDPRENLRRLYQSFLVSHG